MLYVRSGSVTILPGRHQKEPLHTTALFVEDGVTSADLSSELWMFASIWWSIANAEESRSRRSQDAYRLPQKKTRPSNSILSS